LACVDPSLDGPVVVLQDIVEVRHLPVLAAGVQRSFALELSDHGRVSRMPIGVDDTRRWMVLLTQGFGKKRFAAAASCFAESRKSRVAPTESTARQR